MELSVIKKIYGLILCSMVMCLPLHGQTSEQLRNLDDFFQIYRVKKSLRTEKDKVSLKRASSGGVEATLSYWRSLTGRNSDEEICNAYRWLLFGRGQYGQGAIEAFKLYPKLSIINLEFFDVQDGTQLGKKKGQVLPTRKYIPYLNIRVSRNQLLPQAKQVLKMKKKLYKRQCSKIGRNYVDKATFDQSYIR